MEEYSWQKWFSFSEMDTLMDTDVLMIDDMGVEPLMENITIVQWFNLINERQLRGKGTVISTNLNVEELRRRYTERITSRLLDGKLGGFQPHQQPRAGEQRRCQAGETGRQQSQMGEERVAGQHGWASRSR